MTIDLGALRQVGTLSTVVDTPDGDGGSTPTPSPLTPATWRFAIAKNGLRAAERIFSMTIIAHSTHLLNGRFHPGINNKTKVAWTDRAGNAHTANVLAVNDTDGAGVETVALVSEIVQ